MPTKILLLIITVALFSSCSTAYKSGQTPDDVYYSPVRFTGENQDNTKQDEAKTVSSEEIEIRMCSRDRRWRDLDYDYGYQSSPYYYSNCSCSNYGYYYNPNYHPWPVYNTKVPTLNSTPRKVNLNAYTGFNNNTVPDPKTGSGNGINWIKPSARYNNSNKNGVGNIIRSVLSSGNNKSSSSNSNRTYSPSSDNNKSSSGNNNSGTVSRPKRGG